LCIIFFTVSEVTVCEQIPRKFLNENIHSDTSSAELESLNSLSCLKKTKKDNIAMFTETLLQLIKHAFVMNSKNGRYFRIFYNYC